jgi:hypothetical protein
MASVGINHRENRSVVARRKIELRLVELRPIPRQEVQFQFLPKTVSTSLGLRPKTLTCLDPTTLPTASRRRADCANVDAPPNICHAARPEKLIWRLRTPSLDLRSCQMRTSCQTDLTLCVPYASHSGAGNTAISMESSVMT